MARYKIPINTVANPQKRSRIIERSGKKIIGNRISDRLGSPNSSKIMRVSEKMLKNGVLEPTQIRAPDILSEKILSAMGCVVVDDGPLAEKDYSLLIDQTDTETVDNPHKFDAKQFLKLKKQTITIDHVFKNQRDSIFRLDADIPNNYKQVAIENKNKIKKTPYASLTNVVIKAVDLSLNTPGVKAVRAFKEI